MQKQRLKDLFTADDHIEIVATWGVYQAMIAAYREPDRVKVRHLMTTLIASLRSAVPAALKEVAKLGRTLKKTGRRHPGLLRRPRHIQRTHQGHQRPPRTPMRLSPRVQKPHQLCSLIAPRGRRIQTPTTPSIVKSPIADRHDLATQHELWTELASLAPGPKTTPLRGLGIVGWHLGGQISPSADTLDS